MTHSPLHHNVLNHDYVGQSYVASAKKTLWVFWITICFMVVEIASGYWFKSMALLADGWHMASHAAAFAISLFAYHFSKRHSKNPNFSFGTWKIGVLAGYTSAVLLALIGLDVAFQSVQRFLLPQEIDIKDALMVAIMGLAVNAVCAAILYQPRLAHHHNGQSHDGHHHHDHHHHHADLNHRSAFVHVLTDAFTSVTAIAALSLGWLYDWQFLDPLAGLLGAVVIIIWAWQLVRQTGFILTDHTIDAARLSRIRGIIESQPDTQIADFHVWQIGPRHFAAIISIVTHHPQSPDYYKSLLADMSDLVHVSVEINGCQHHDCRT